MTIMRLTFPTFCGVTAIRKIVIFRLAIALVVVTISACNSLVSPGVNDLANETASSQVIAQSAIATERVGDVREQRLADDLSSDVTDAVITAINDFSLVLHRAQANGQPDKNMIASGYSMATALSFLRAGAAGTTDGELASLLAQDAIVETEVHRSLNAISQNLDTRNNKKLVLNTANRIFTKPGLPLKTEFLDIAAGEYAAPITEIDFATQTQAAIKLINSWASEQTHGFINEIANNSNVDRGTQVALLNAIFLDAAWPLPFDDLDQRDFTTASGEIKQVPSFGKERLLARSVESDVTVVDIPYAGRELSMTIMMPDDLSKFESAFTVERLNSIVNSLEKTKVVFTMPAFKTENVIDANQLLQSIGLLTQDLDMSDMFAQPIDEKLVLTVQQKARIEVDRNGTKAAAVTAALVGITSAPESEPEIIRIDKPFLYVLRDTTTGLLLFSGRVMDPSL